MPTAAILVVYVGMAYLVIKGFPDPIVDEPIYASSAWEFAHTGRIQISNISAPNAVFEAIWGGLFTFALGETIETLRISTIALTAISGPFVYLLCRLLGGSRNVSALAVGAYLFAPLAFQLSITFQTDAHLVALTVMAITVIAYGFTRETHYVRFLFIGSGLVALAFLSRPQALVVVIAASAAWHVHRRDRTGRIKGIVVLATLPALVVVAYSVWSVTVGGNYMRGLYVERLLALNPMTYLVVGAQAAIDGMLSMGMFALPFLPLLLPTAREGIRRSRRLAIYLATVLGTVALSLPFSKQGPLFDGSWLSTTGFGAVDRSFLGSPPALPLWAVAVVIIAFAFSAYLLIMSLPPKELSQGAQSSYYLMTFTLLGFIAGAVISTLGVHDRIIDRYWLPILPPLVVLAGSVAKVTRPRLFIAWSTLSVLALVSVLGIIDSFNTYRTAGDFADDVVSQGINPLALDGGASWSAATFGLNDHDPAFLDRPGPFWIKFYAVQSDPEYAIALEPLEGYKVLERQEYRSMLHPGDDYMYLVHRDPRLPFYIKQSGR